MNVSIENNIELIEKIQNNIEFYKENLDMDTILKKLTPQDIDSMIDSEVLSAEIYRLCTNDIRWINSKAKFEYSEVMRYPTYLLYSSIFSDAGQKVKKPKTIEERKKSLNEWKGNIKEIIDYEISIVVEEYIKNHLKISMEEIINKLNLQEQEIYNNNKQEINNFFVGAINKVN